jgi:ABC-type glycerol-3-phosphate transport system substrate-binding protein
MIRKRFGFLIIALLLIAALTMCTRNSQSAAPSTTSTTTSASSTSDILRGQEVVIGNWWGDYDVNTNQPRTEIEEMRLEWRRRVLQENGVIIRDKQIGGWGEQLGTAVTSIMAGNPAAHVFILQPDWAMSLIRQNLAYPISDSTVAGFLKNSEAIVGRQTAYNQMVGEAFTFDGKQYAFAVGLPTGRQGVYWNKRLFREAGIDPELPYNMQRDGTWTWDNFFELCKRLARDRDNDGRIDTWSMPSLSNGEMYNYLIYSNGANWVLKDASGNFANGTSRPELLEALDFSRRVTLEGGTMPQPEGSNWDWFLPAFYDGHVAMIFEEVYRRGSMQDMPDDWGFVVPPMGPRVTQWRFAVMDNVLLIPATFSAQQVDVILTAVNLWNTPVDDDWKTGLYPFYRDRRAVDESTALLRDPRYHFFQNNVVIPGLNLGDIVWRLMSFEGEPAQLVESVSQSWNATIAEANR